MKIPKQLVFLGFVYELVWRSKSLAPKVTLVKLQTSLTIRAGDVYGLFSNAPGTGIYMLPVKRIAMRDAGTHHRGRKLFERWTDYEADLEFRFDIPDSATTLTRVGTLEKIEYTSDKLERPGDRKGDFSLYTHKYKTPLHLYSDREQNPRVFGARINSKRIVTSRGLVG